MFLNASAHFIRWYKLKFLAKIKVLMLDNDEKSNVAILSPKLWHYSWNNMLFCTSAKWCSKTKNFHILKVSCACLISSHLQPASWEDVLLYIFNLINHVSSSVLYFKTPLNHLSSFVNLPSTLNLEPRAFYCVVFILSP